MGDGKNSYRIDGLLINQIIVDDVITPQSRYLATIYLKREFN